MGRADQRTELVRRVATVSALKVVEGETWSVTALGDIAGDFIWLIVDKEVRS